MSLWSRECPVCADIGWCNDHPIKDHDDMTTKPNEPEGQMLVPAQPTDAMIDAALTTGARFGRAAMVNIWRSMLSATPANPVADAGGVTDADKKLLGHIVSWVHCPAIMSVDQVEQMIAAHRLQSVAAATAAKDARDPLRDIVLRYIDRMNDVAPECGDPADRILGEFASEVNDVLKAERAALSEAGEAGAKD